MSVKKFMTDVLPLKPFFYIARVCQVLLSSTILYFRAVLLAIKLPGPKIVPLMGNVLMVNNKDMLSKTAVEMATQNEPLQRFWVTIFPFFLIIEPEHIQLVLLSKKHTNKVFLYELLHDFLGPGLVVSNGEKWNTHRKLIQPAFNSNILETFIPLFVKSSEVFVQSLNNESMDNEINISEFINTFVVDVISGAVLGQSIDKKSDLDRPESSIRKGQLNATYRVSNPWLLSETLYSMTQKSANELDKKKKLQKYATKMIENRKSLKQLGEQNDNKCFVDFLIEISEKNPSFTSNDVISEACTMMLAGQDTVGSATAICIFLLAQNLDCQKKCIEEIENIFGTDNRNPSISDLHDMIYLEMCIKETLRLYPSVPGFSRKITKDLKMGKHTIPANANVVISPFITHRLSHFYSDPEKFNPERFLPENSFDRHPYAYIPFSGGPRNCIGYRFAMLEMKTIISQMLRNFELFPVPQKNTFQPVFRVTLRASGGLWIRLKKQT